MIEGADQKACRTIPMGRRSVTGGLPVRGRMIPYESTLERDLLFLLDADRAVKRVIEQPVRIPYVSMAGRRSSYVPDYQADRHGVPGLLAEVKYQDELRERRMELASRFRAAVAFARARGMRFRIFTEAKIRTPYLANLKFLKRYPAAAHCDDPTEEHLVATLEAIGTATPTALVEAAYGCHDHRASAIPVLWGLVGTGRIAADLRAPLTMSSALAVAPGRGTEWPGPHDIDLPLGEARWRRAGLAPPPRSPLVGMHQADEHEAAVEHGEDRR